VDAAPEHEPRGQAYGGGLVPSPYPGGRGACPATWGPAAAASPPATGFWCAIHLHGRQLCHPALFVPCSCRFSPLIVRFAQKRRSWFHPLCRLPCSGAATSLWTTPSGAAPSPAPPAVSSASSPAALSSTRAPTTAVAACWAASSQRSCRTAPPAQHRAPAAGFPHATSYPPGCSEPAPSTPSTQPAASQQPLPAAAPVDSSSRGGSGGAAASPRRCRRRAEASGRCGCRAEASGEQR